jgi:2-polyprenyl-3-methyl-5-hydroxy-6-metoxy-1,4-benzoquinol methylase
MLNSSLNSIKSGQENNQERKDLISRIIATYSGITRLYAMVRFKIIHLQFLEEIVQYLPEEGDILDLGCGFGLFSLYMASCRPHAHIVGLDINSRRIQTAQASARQLGIDNASFVQHDLREWKPDRAITAAYALDVFHHIPVGIGNELITALYDQLELGGRFMLKDIDTSPRLMLLFTYALDLAMAPRDQFYYRSHKVWQQQLGRAGFEPIYLHRMWDILPYPHILMVCSKTGQ